MYAGTSPFQALAVYAVIAYMDSVNGVWFPIGGLHALSRALAIVGDAWGGALDVVKTPDDRYRP